LLTYKGLAASEDEIFDFFQGVLDGNCEGEMFLVLCDFVCEFIKAHEVDGIVLTDVRVQAKEHLDTIIYTHQNFTSSMKAQALEKLRATEDPAAVASDFGLKSPWTILYWKNQRDEQESLEKIQLLSPHRATPSTGRKRELVQEQELLDWILSQKDGSLTKQDIITHMMESYPKFVSAKSYAALKIWVLRFLKRHISRAGLPNPDMMAAANPAAVGVEARDSNHNNSNGISVGRSTNTKDRVSTGSNELSSATRTLSRKRKASSNRYMIHSNEFKLHALEMLDQGKTIAEVSEALGLKSPNTLVYWNSIRDKLETAEKKRYRLHGGGRKSSCPFESDLLAWVSERHAKGYETDVKTLLDHLIKNHPSFVEGKKEPTIRKWILRFFKRFMKTTVCGPITTGSRQIGERSSKQKEGVESQDSNEVEDIMEVNLSTNKSPIGAMVTEDQIFL
jgi:transposase-like protein